MKNKPVIKVTLQRGAAFKSPVVGAYAKNHYTITISDGLRTVTDKVACDRTGSRAHAAEVVSKMLGVERQWDLSAMATAAGYDLEFTSKG